MSQVFVCLFALVGLAVIIAWVQPMKRYNDRQEKQQAERQAKAEAEALARKKAHEARVAHALRTAQAPKPERKANLQAVPKAAPRATAQREEVKSRSDAADDFIQRQNVIAAMSFDDSFTPPRSSSSSCDSSSSAPDSGGSSYTGGGDSGGSCGSDY